MVTVGQVKKDGKISVEFSYKNGQGQAVMLAGNFNDWAPIPMSVDDQGVAAVSLKLQPGYYEYRFIVAGEWITDENNPNISANDFGTFNSVLKLE